jgi:shikimate kinase
MSQPVIVLIGPPGSGKTTVGAALAERLGWPLVDTDSLVEATTGRSVPDIFVGEGEAAFRTYERAAVRLALGVDPDEGGRLGTAPDAAGRVVALGGGAAMDEATQKLLDPARTVFLDVSDAEGVRRVGLSGPRPLLAVSPRAQWRAQMAVRRPVYERLASLHLLTDGRAPSELAAAIAATLAA